MKYAEALARVISSVQERELVDFTRAIAKIPSVHGDEKAIAEACAQRLDELGIESQMLDAAENRPNVLGWIRGEGGGKSLTLNGHIDTVLEVLGWTVNQYGGELIDGKIYGHGVSNMKASDAAMIYAASAIKRAGISLKGDLLVALVVGECQGGIGTLDLMKRGIKTDRFVCCEPTYLNILTVHSATQYFRVKIYGRTAHFGTHDHGVNAIMKMFNLTERLGPMHVEISQGDWVRYDCKPLYSGLPRYHLSYIRGGLTEQLREDGGWSNTPDFCRAVFNVRVPPTKEIESTRQDIENVLSGMHGEQKDFKFQVESIRDMPGFEAPSNSVVAEAVGAAYREILGGEPSIGGVQPYMFMGSDSGNMQLAGMRDGVLIGPGNFTSSVPDEHVEVDKLIAAAKIYAASVLKLCGIAER